MYIACSLGRPPGQHCLMCLCVTMSHTGYHPDIVYWYIAHRFPGIRWRRLSTLLIHVHEPPCLPSWDFVYCLHRSPGPRWRRLTTWSGPRPMSHHVTHPEILPMRRSPGPRWRRPSTWSGPRPVGPTAASRRTISTTWPPRRSGRERGQALSISETGNKQRVK